MALFNGPWLNFPSEKRAELKHPEAPSSGCSLSQQGTAPKSPFFLQYRGPVFGAALGSLWSPLKGPGPEISPPNLQKFPIQGKEVGLSSLVPEGGEFWF